MEPDISKQPQYDQRALVPDLSLYFRRWQDGSKQVGQALSPQQGVAYGPGDHEILDIFEPSGTPKGLHVHFHGGAWRALSSQDGWFVAPPWVDAGYCFVSVNFGLLPAVSLFTQMDQARRALEWCGLNLTAQMGTGGISLSGHSSGAYLAAMAGLANWGRPQPDIRATILASGVYDLRAVQQSQRNDYLDLTAAEAISLSPAGHLNAQTPPTTVLWSVNELPEFQQQSSDMVEKLEKRGPVQTCAADTPNHFDTWDLITPELLLP